MKKYYAIFNISPMSTHEEIKKAYKKLAMKWHPDKNLDNVEVAKQKFQEINEAYDKIINRPKQMLKVKTFRRSKTVTTVFRNGKKITRMVINENGKITESLYVNGQLIETIYR